MNGLDLVWSAMNDEFETFRKFFEECFGEGSEGFAGTKLSGQMLISAILNKKQETAFYLVNKGAALNVQNEYGDTPVNALVHGHCYGNKCDRDYELLKLMLDKGADINIKNLHRMQPIDWVLGEDIEMFSLMLDYHPEIYECKHECIIKYRDYYQLMIEKGVIEKDESKMDLYALAEDGTAKTFMERFDKSLLREKNEYGDTLIECAIYGKNWEVVKFLLSQGIDINEKVWKGEDTVLYAVIEIINIIVKPETPKEQRTISDETMAFIKYLLDNGADINAANPLSSLELAIPKKNHTNDQMELFKMLLDYNPKIDEDFMETLEIRKTDELCELLRSRGLIE